MFTHRCHYLNVKIHMNWLNIHFDSSEAEKKIPKPHQHIFCIKFTEFRMFRVAVRTLNVSNRICNQKSFNISHSEFNVQSVRRWRYRRPLELGTTKSKLFRIPEHPPPNLEEYNELKRLNIIYKWVSSKFKCPLIYGILIKLFYFHTEEKWRHCVHSLKKKTENVMRP